MPLRSALDAAIVFNFKIYLYIFSAPRFENSRGAARGRLGWVREQDCNRASGAAHNLISGKQSISRFVLLVIWLFGCTKRHITFFPVPDPTPALLRAFIGPAGADDQRGSWLEPGAAVRRG